ncbi:flagellar basal body rod protein FlgB [Sulfurimonas autotrophica]|uniref:Flagellar basal body rod protein FlgB n=1 Tax=Sulfurimonas autotrophica (strain ATCC BAA-671 / DSM 16294 / JCM 11897 / OK10) TaxID=563040 RepID=E0UUE4_SULAO|nr:flagellar basal body rod protein FlgB [Sulfurimonas autotrophica]ADN08380.1 flagellar basal-body rod protein FlgB [Sulfurimonas autotrophica DSM 16294]
MSIEISKTHALLAKALDYRAARQDMISSNIANADTPYYKPRDISFEDALIAKKNELYQDNAHQLKMAQTNSGHLQPKAQASQIKPTLYFRDGHMARNDGNSVDIDVETTEMSKNSIMFNAIVMASKKDAAIFKSVIDASAKVN